MPKFYFTAGRGTEKFVQEELKVKLQAVEVQVQDGRVLCETENTKTAENGMRRLRTVERAFVLVSMVATHTIKYLAPSVIISVLKQRLLTKESLLEAFRVYRDLHQGMDQSELVEEPSPKRLRTDAGLKQNNSSPSFRISVKCSGRFGKKLNPQVVGGCLGRELAKALAWKVDLRHPDLEVCVHLGDQWFIAGIPIFRQPLSKRSFIPDPGLRSTVAAIMSSLASVQPGEVVLDPMCGKATVLLEGTVSQPAALYLGVDKDESQLAAAAANVRHACLSRVMLLQADALNLPLPASSVDKIVCDAPFGQKFQTTQSLEEFYSIFLQEWARVLKPSGLAVLLTSAALKDSIIRITSQSQSQSLAAGTTDCQAGRSNATSPSLPAQQCQNHGSDSVSTCSGMEGPCEGDWKVKCLGESNADSGGVETDACEGRVCGSRDVKLEGPVSRKEDQHTCEAEKHECQRDSEVCRTSTTRDRCLCPRQASSLASDLSKSPHGSSKQGNSSSPLHSQHPHMESSDLHSSKTGEDVDSTDCVQYPLCNEEKKSCPSASNQKLESTCKGKARTGQRHGDSSLTSAKSLSVVKQHLSVVEQHYVKLGETHAHIILMKCEERQTK